MGTYNRTVWKDHIKDQNGNVIQQGTPVSAQNLNNIEKQIVVLSAKENTLAELVRESIPSGFTTLSDLDYTYMSTNPNTIKLASDSVAYVNGYKIVIPAGTVITLDAPPTTGTREDLVFLECWKQADANGTEQLNWRIRVVDDIDFNTYPEGISNNVSPNTCNSLVKPQGGNTTPISGTTWNINFLSKTQRNIVVSQGWNGNYTANLPFLNDIGLYVAGYGEGTKASFGTTDGYIYAIPMFKVHRRNSGGYSVDNGNGSKVYATTETGSTVPTSTSATVNNASIFAVGDKIYIGNNTSAYTTIITAISGNTLTYKPTAYTAYAGWHWIIGKCSDRPDLTFADIVVDRDIIDLRHKVSLTGFNYQQLLEENFDKLLRGELQTSAKTTMLKTYHGIPKTPIDSNTVFYASFDGTTTAEIGGIPSNTYSTVYYRPSVTGLGAVNSDISGDNKALNWNLNIPASVATIDLMAYLYKTPKSWEGDVFNFVTDTFSVNLEVCSSTSQMHIWSTSQNCDYHLFNIDLPSNLGKTIHFRIVFSSNKIAQVYINGKIVANLWGNGSTPIPAFTTIKQIQLANNYWIESDVSISNIDRGSNFATLPQDFVDGYARISPAFNGQRQIFSDALTAQYTCEKIPVSGTRPKQFAVTQGTIGTWSAGDKATVTGLGGEIISGVIDSDTALAKITENNSTQSNPVTLHVDDASKLAVSDVLKLIANNGMGFTADLIIQSIDATNNTITISNPSYYTFTNDSYLCEATASSSSPLVKTNVAGTATAGGASAITLPSTFSPTDDTYNGLDIMITSGTGAGQRKTISDYVGSTKVATVSSAWDTPPNNTSVFIIYGVPVTGTWSGLGTNVATFTLGTNYAISNQDLQVEYSLNQVAGQGGISEVLTTTLAGEYGGKKLVVNPSVHIRDDFAGKTTGDTTVCPHIEKRGNGDSLGIPSLLSYEEPNYSNIATLDGLTQMQNTNVNGQMAQILLQFNLIRMVEDKFGPIPALDKVKWCKDNISRIICNAYAYGSCPSGNKLKLTTWRVGVAQWDPYWDTNDVITGNAPTHVYRDVNGSFFVTDSIDINGMANFLLYTDASDGVTPSQVSLDYAYLDIVLKTPTGYDVLAPGNPRRDDGKANMLLIRKETKEIQCFMDASNTDGIVTYGDYVPYQGQAIALGIIKATSDKIFLTSAGTGNPRAYSSMQYCDSLYRLVGNNIPLYKYLNDDISVNIGSYQINNMYLPILYFWGGKRYSSIGSFNAALDTFGVDANKLPNKSICYSVYAGLKAINNELHLVIRGICLYDNSAYNCDFKISYRPLIK